MVLRIPTAFSSAPILDYSLISAACVPKGPLVNAQRSVINRDGFQLQVGLLAIRICRVSVSVGLHGIMAFMNSEPLKLLKAVCNCERLLAVPPFHWPEFLSAHREGESATIEITVSPGLHWFGGHFPGQPVLPGVVQTHWAALLASAIFNQPDEFSGLTRLKFKAPLLPDQTVFLQLTHSPARRLINYRYHSSDTDFSSGTLHFRELVV